MKLIYLTILFALTIGASGQNLVPNPSFEDTLQPLCFWYQTPYEFSKAVKDWYMPTLGSSDLFSSHLSIACDLNPTSLSLWSVGWQVPRTGAHHAGLVTYVIPDSSFGAPPKEYREYISVKLSSKLEIGKLYVAEMFVSLADSIEFATNSLGMCFSDTNLLDTTHTTLIDLKPQVVEESIIDNNIAWTRVRGRFIAKSNYEYLTIGNFSGDSLTDTITNSAPKRIMQSGLSYYFIDDVSVKESMLSSEDTLICKGDTALLISYVDLIGWAIDSLPNALISTNDTLVVAPKEPTNYLLITQDDTVSIKVDLYSESKLEIGKDTSLCLGETYNAQVPVGYGDILWQNGSTDSILQISEPGIYWVSVGDYCGPITDTIRVDFFDCSTTLEMPNVFSPNKDGLNEHFKPITISGIEGGQLLIFNRNGEQVYESDINSAQWDGTHNDMDCPEGVYYWVASYSNTVSEQKVMKGFLTLVR